MIAARSVRLAALGFVHEANSFSPLAVDMADVQAALRLGEAVRDEHADAHSTMAGFLAVAGPSVDVAPLAFGFPTPAGLLTEAALGHVAGVFRDQLAAQGPWDGVLLALHGSAGADGVPDADVVLARAVRDTVGAAVPIGLVLDLHANVPPGLADVADVVLAYRTNPHIDARERGLAAAALVVDSVRGRIRPVSEVVRVPAVIGILRQGTGEEPMRALVAAADSVAGRPGILAASVTEGYPWADVPWLGMTACVVADGDREAARTAAAELAGYIWARREAMVGRAVSIEEAVARTRALASGPVLLLDTGDNVGAGGPGDATAILHAARAAKLSGVLAILVDPEAVAVCFRAGLGCRIDASVGGRTDPSAGPPLPVMGTVRALSSDGSFEEPEARHGGLRLFSAGPTAVIETASETLVLTSRRLMSTSLVQLTSLGVDPRRARMIVAKGVHSPRAAYEPIAVAVVAVETPGVTAIDLAALPYRHRPRPLYPFETDAIFRP